MKINLVGSFKINAPFGTEIAFQKGLEHCGVELNIADPHYDNEKIKENVDATIVFKTAKKYNEQLKNVSGVKIVYQPDDCRFYHIQELMKEMRSYCEFALSFDHSSAVMAKEQFGYKHSKELLVTADSDLYRPLDLEKDIDFCFVGSLSSGSNHASRRKMLQLLSSNGFKVSYACDLYDIEEIIRIYNRTKIVLNHATDVGQPFGSGYGYQCRHFETGFTRSCLLSNVVLGQQKLFNFAQFNSEETLFLQAESLLNDHEKRKYLANEFYNEIKLFNSPAVRGQEILDFISECQKL